MTATCPASSPTSPAACTTSRAAAQALAERLDEICAEVSEAIAGGARIIVLSDRHSTADLAPIPSLLLTGAVHHHLVREKTRTQVGLLVEAGDVREVHHVALLVGYGAAAVNPYLAMESVEDLAREGYYVKAEPEKAVANLIKGLGKGVLKVMSKMGVSTVASYTGAQIFEAVGLSQAVVDRYFTGTTSKLGGIELDTIAEEVARRHATAYPRGGIAPAHRELEIGGEYQWRREGEPHLFDPETVFRLQHATRSGSYDIFKQYTSRVDEQSERLMTLRGLFRFKDAGGDRPPADQHRRGRAGLRDRQALLHRRDVLRLHQPGGARDPRHRHEPAGRQVQHRRGRRGRRPAPRPRAPQLDQAGRVGPLRRDVGVPHQRRRHPDQDGAGRQARRGRPAARPQGLPVGGQDPALDAGRRPDQPAAAPRHLLDRGPGAADPRPQERQPERARARQARLRGRRRHGRGGRLQGARGRRADLRPRRRHRRLAADVAQARGRSVGARPRRDPADAAAQRPARPDRGADRRPAQDRPRRRHRRAARRRGVRLRHRAAGRQRLHHDAGLPPRHLPGGRGDAEPRPARALQRQGGVRRQLLHLRRRGGARAPRRARLPHPRRGHRPGRARSTSRRPSTTGRPPAST